jgi:ElaB/YqjD/DUF883 family membrane-anchored ribosome-binding protein
MQTIDKASRSAHKTVDKITHAANQTAAAFGEKGKQLKDSEQELMKNCRGYVRDSPLTSVGIAVGAGYLLSLLLRGHDAVEDHQPSRSQ